MGVILIKKEPLMIIMDDIMPIHRTTHEHQIDAFYVLIYFMKNLLKLAEIDSLEECWINT
jgi:hypothetical protein